MLDPISVLSVTIFSAIMSTAVLGSLLSTAIPGVRRWFAASVMAIAALILLLLQGIGPRWLTILVANQVLAVAMLVILQGCRQFAGLRPERVAEYASLLTLLAGMAYWTYAVPDLAARIVIVSLFYTYAYIAVGWTVHAARPLSRSRYAYWFVTIGAGLGAVGHLGRGLVYGLGWAQQTELLQSTPVNIAFLALGVLALPWLSIGMVLLVHDRLAHRLERLANLDELTGILARRAFLAQADAAVRAATRTRRPLVLAIVDIDHFKHVNDSRGHAAGDRVLAHFTGVIASNLRAGDGFGRLGGEEFAILCPDTSMPEAMALLNRLRGRMAGDESALAAGKLKVTFSAGVDQYRPGETLSSLMARADAALYTAKAMGRDRVVAVAADDDPTPERQPGLAG